MFTLVRKCARVVMNSDRIPKGCYCYDENGLCPFWRLDENQPYQRNGYCEYLQRGDWEAEIPDDFPDGFPLSALSLLWDQVKECGVNDG